MDTVDIRSLSGEAVAVLEVTDATLPQDLISQLAGEGTCPVEYQGLVFQDTALARDQTLADQGVMPGSLLSRVVLAPLVEELDLLGRHENVRSLAQWLLFARAEINQICPQTGDTVLIRKIRHRCHEFVRVLIEYRADMAQANAQTGEFPLLVAVQHFNSLKVLVELRANVQQAHQQTGDFPLMVAVRRGWTHTCELLLRARADPHQESLTNGDFALLVATQLPENNFCFELLLRMQAEPGQVNSHTSDFPLVEAVRRRSTQRVRRLLFARADPNQSGPQGDRPDDQEQSSYVGRIGSDSPLSVATHNNDDSTMLLLLGARARP